MTQERLDRPRHSESSEEIKADIEQTRAQMSARIDTIQERLDPDRLKVQAQEAAKDILHEAQDSAKQVINDAAHSFSEYLEDSAHSMTEYVRNHRNEIGRSVVSTMKRNPLPTALIGLGLGWLAVNSLGGGSSTSRQHRRRDFEYGRRYDGGYEQSRFNDHERWEREQLYGGVEGRGGFEGNREYTQGTYSGQVGMRGQVYGYETDTRHADGDKMSSRVQGMAHDATHRAQEMGQETMHRAQEVGQDTMHRAQEMGQETMHRAQEMGQDTMHRAQEMGKDTMHRAQEGWQQVGEQVSESFQGAGRQAGRWSGQAGRQLYRTGRGMGHQLQHGLEDNPLPFGFFAFATGAALAMLLPQTRAENRMVGEYRDEFMQTAGEAAESAMHRAQSVIEEVRPEVEESVQRFTSQVKEAGESAMDDFRHAADKAQESVKQEAETGMRSASGQGSGGKSDGSMAMNQDIFKGQWNQIQGDINKKWGKLTNDDMTQIEGDYEKFLGRLQERYGYERARAEQETDTFLRDHKSTRDRFDRQQSGTAGSGSAGGMAINRDTFKGQWNQMKGEIKSQWGKLTDDDVSQIEGDYDKFLGRIQERYGYSRERAEQEISKIKAR